MGEQVRAGNVDFWVERRGQGPEVLIISGLADPVEAWQFQLDGLQDRYRLTACDNRGVGRTPMGEGARFEVLPEEAHRPFTENPEEFNARVDAFWREVDKQD
jgi:pimeloyl-ACP methyl ester carboxylesterase